MRGVKWDEANLLQNEEEKVPRMKIDEPKTPYYGRQEHDSDEEAPVPSELHGLEEAISKAAEARRGIEHKVEEVSDEAKRKEEFLKKRKAHYREFQVAASRAGAESDPEADGL